MFSIYSNITTHNMEAYNVPGEAQPEFFLSEVHCNGNETQLMDCPHLGKDENECHYGGWGWWSDSNKQMFIECDISTYR